MILKLKAIIYRHTGIYLAHKEQLDYMESREFWIAFYEMLDTVAKEDDLTLRDVQGLLIGMWQAKHGFYRKFKFSR